MTLRELMNRVDEAAWREQVPTLVGLMEMKSPVAAIEKMGEEIVVTAFQNGYVVYQNGEHATVFPLHDCRKDYAEKDQMDTEHSLSFEVFADQPWQTRVFMEGERRLVHNSNNRRRYFNEVSYDGFAEGGDFLSDGGTSDPLMFLMEKESREEELEKLETEIQELKDRLLDPSLSSDYMKLNGIQEEIDAKDEEILSLMEEYDRLDTMIAQLTDSAAKEKDTGLEEGGKQ